MNSISLLYTKKLVLIYIEIKFIVLNFMNNIYYIKITSINIKYKFYFVPFCKKKIILIKDTYIHIISVFHMFNNLNSKILNRTSTLKQKISIISLNFIIQFL